jgi:hypothetical protein
LKVRRRFHSALTSLKYLRHDRHDQGARPEDEHVLGLAQVEAPGAADEQVADGQVEERAT